ncbi:hypothetical protein FS837_001362 [Tulasnella sp. UAMH 9824]|nr:hypothetical protein FS837_001362 [Tulasnella sp. UAMH 9824]
MLRRARISPLLQRVPSTIRCYHLQHNQHLPQDFFFGLPTGSPKGKEPEKSSPERVSDAEWDVRVGRATDVLDSTIPAFFESGLVISASPDTLSHHQRNKSRDFTDDPHPIYSKNLCLTYTPPTALPPPFPRTLRVEGLSLYQASAMFMRTSLMTLYSDCNVTVIRKNIKSPSRRERQLQLSMLVGGRSRLTGSPAEWDVKCTYSFSPLSGLIYLHEVESIDPAPGLHVLDALRLSLSRVLGVDEPRVSDVGGAGKLPVAPGGTPQATSSPRAPQWAELREVIKT